MKEVTIKRFEKGDLIKGKKGNGYTITNEDMVRGVVIRTYGSDRMDIKGLEFKSGYSSDVEFSVDNDPDKFELLPKVNNKASEDAKLEIRVIAEKGSEFVNASMNYKGSIYGAHAECSLDDEFDLRKGATLAISRVFDLMDEVALRVKIGAEAKTPDGPVKIGDLVRVLSCTVSGGLKDGDLTEVMGIGQHGSGDKPYIYVASKTKTCYDGDDCVVPGRRALKHPFTYLAPCDYEILPEQPVRPKK